jgi:formate hydrogenlyase subunit 6/NADH:ubiquinone oxidoreductase subunit I
MRQRLSIQRPGTDNDRQGEQKIRHALQHRPLHFCAQCVESCRFGCLEMSDEMWELASIKKEPFEVHYGREEDIQLLLENAARPETNPPC